MEATAAPPKPRLVIWKLVLENFKSYAGKRVVGPFHKCFTAIVGPNGSGKSNVIDALLFVFGQRAKKLRQDKLSELIHFSEDHQNIESAKVSVYFHEIIDRPNDQYEVVPDSTLIVSRAAYKSNKSTYFINDEASTFTQVTKLLKARGIDLDHNRFLILQGEVEQIAMMKPKAQTQHDVGMLEYLEDIIGSIGYVEKIATAATKVEKLNDERNEKVNRVKAAEKERDHLEEAKNEAMDYVTKEKELLEKQSMLAQLRRFECDSKAAAEMKKKIVIEAKWREEKERMKQLNATVSAKDSEFKKEREEFGRMTKEMGNAKANLAVYERNHIQLEQDIKHLKEKRKTLAEEIKKNEKKAQEKLEDAEAASKEADECADELGQLEAAAAEEERKLEVILESLKGETAGLHDAMEEKQKEFMPFQKRLHAAQADVDLAKSQRDLLAQRPTLVATKLAEAEKQLADVKGAVAEKKALLETTRTRQAQAQSRAKVLEKQVAQSREEEQKLAADVRRLQSSIEHTRATAQAQTQRSLLITRLMDAARSGTLKGIRGRLGDLGSIDPKFDVAISTAAPTLDHIVAETVEAASAAIAFLKKEMLGSASFIVLEKIEYLRRNMGSLTTPEGVSRLYDLVKSKKPEYATAFYFALRDTLVAKDLEQARRIAYGPTRFKVVTLTGEVIDVSGTMSGGGNTSTSGRMNTVAHTSEDATSSRDFKTMAKELEKQSAALQELRMQREEEEKELEALKKELEHLPVQARKLDMDVEALTKQSADLKARLKQLQPQAQLTEEEEESLAALEKQIARGERAVKKIEEEAAEVKAEVSGLEKAIAAAGGEKLKRQKTKFEAATKAVDDLRRKINRAKVRLTSGKKESTQARSAFKEAEAQLAKTETDLEKKKAKLQKLNDSAGDVKEAYKALEAKHEEKEKKVDAAQRELQSMKDNAAAMRSTELNLEAELTDSSRVLHGHQKEAQSYAQRITELHKKYAVLYHDYLADEEQQLEEEGEEAEKAVSDNEMEEDKDEDEENDEEKEEEGEEEEEEEEEVEDGEEEEEEDDEEEGRAKRARTNKKKKERKPTKAAAAPVKKVQPRKSIGKKGTRGTLKVLSADELGRLSLAQIVVEVGTKEDELKALRPNLQALKQYREKNRDYETKAKELAKVTEQRDGQRALYDSLRKKRLDVFMEGYAQITMKLKEMYQMITIGGDAELELVDSLDPFSEGVMFSVRPPKKSWKNIINLSGGEKTLASLALVFALHHYKPTPIYVMDEIDAALDFRNVSIIGHYIKERTKDAQFLVISLRNNMFELADRVVGIYKTHNASKSLPLNPHAFGQVLAAATATAQGARSASASADNNDKENRAPPQVLSV